MATMQDAVRLLMVHSREAARELARRSPSSPIYQQLYNRFAGDVLSDPAITLTADERTLIAEYVTASSDVQGKRLQVRLSLEQYARLETDAAAEGMDVSKYVRLKLGLEDG